MRQGGPQAALSFGIVNPVSQPVASATPDATASPMSNSAASKSEKNSSRGFLDLMQAAMGKEQAAPGSTPASGPSSTEEAPAGDDAGSGLAQGRLRAEFALLAGQRVGRCSREGDIPAKGSTAPKKPRVAMGHADKANADNTNAEGSSPAESNDGGAGVAPMTPQVAVVTPQDGLADAALTGASLIIAEEAAGVGAAVAVETPHSPKESSEASETEHGQAAPYPALLIHRSRLPSETTVESGELPAEGSPALGAKPAAGSTTDEASLTTPVWMRVLPGAHSPSSSSPALSGRGEPSSSIANATANEAVPAVTRAASSSHTAATAPAATTNGSELGESTVQIKTPADIHAKQDIAFAARLTSNEGATASESSTPPQRTPATSRASAELEPAESQASTAKDSDAHAGAEPLTATSAFSHTKATQPAAEGMAAWGTSSTDVRGASPVTPAKSSSTEHTTSITPPAEPPSATTPASRTVRELNLKLTGDQAQSADVRMVERNGEVRVMVRASDSALASSLQGDLTDLLSHLSGRGITTELWRPAGAGAASSGADERSGNGAGTQSDAQGGNASHQDSGGHARGQREPAPEWFEETFENVKSRFGRRSSQ